MMTPTSAPRTRTLPEKSESAVSRLFYSSSFFREMFTELVRISLGINEVPDTKKIQSEIDDK